MPGLFIGCSGFSYPHWRGVFYPEKLSQTLWFDYYCSVFSTVELNVTFYRLLKPETFERWSRNSPPGFTFSVKGSRFITHVKRLNAPEGPLERFFEGVLRLGEKLSVVLWQFPPGFSRDTARLERFLASLNPYPVRNSLEFRNESWLTDEIIALCREAGASLCMADWPRFIADLPVTSGFVYMRRHGRGGSYAGRYSAGELNSDAQRIREYLRRGLEVHIYFNNDACGYAAMNARELSDIMGDGAGKTPSTDGPAPLKEV
jgi:uncharacterized protein YecE (DUF72 family)